MISVADARTAVIPKENRKAKSAGSQIISSSPRLIPSQIRSSTRRRGSRDRMLMMPQAWKARKKKQAERRKYMPDNNDAPELEQALEALKELVPLLRRFKRR